MENVTQTAAKTPLTPAQVKVVVALAGGQTITDAARSVGVGRSTIHSWLSKDTDFIKKYDIIRQNFEDELIDQIIEIRMLALKKLRAILEDPDAAASVQLRAALAVLKDTLHPPPERTRPFPEYAPELSPDPDKAEQIETLSIAAGASNKPALDKNEHIRTISAAAGATPRNAPCPCGSREKYKRCCGRNAPPVLNAA